MKVGNKLLNRIVSLGMLAVVLLSGFWSLGVSNSYAIDKSKYSFLSSSYDFGYYNASTYELYSFVGGSDNIVSFFNHPYSNIYQFMRIMISSSPISGTRNTRLFSIKSDDSFDESSSSYNFVHQDYITYNGTKYYYYGEGSSSSGDFVPEWFGNLGSFYNCHFTYQEWNDLKLGNLVMGYVSGSLDSTNFTMVSEGEDISTDETTWQGGQDNPIKKDDFGYPQIYNSTYIHNDPNNLETLDKLYSGQDFQWKKKTTTGFDLTNNDYNYTYVECKVKANYQYNDKFSGKGSWHDFASYGEMGNLGKVRAESLSHYYTFQEFQEALPKTSNELPDHKMRAIKSSAVYYFRVVCMKTSSTVVIPDEKDCKYYAGPWRSITVTKINGKDGTSIVEDGDMDENGEWKKDDSSNDNGKDIDNGSAEGDDLSDASDKAHETINSNANKSTLDLDSAKAFINQVADVPKMIADIFSFLPDWVKYSFAFGFALIPILIIFKLIRG